MKTFVTAAAIAAWCLASAAEAATVSYNFGTTAGGFTAAPTSSDLTNGSVGSIAIGNTLGSVSAPLSASSASSGYTGASGNGNIGNAVKTGALNQSTSSYYATTFTAASDYTISLTGVSFGTRSTLTGPTTIGLYASTDGFASSTLLGSVTPANDSTWAAFAPTLTPFTSAAGGSFELRFYTYGGTGTASSGTINSRVDDLSFTVATTPVGAPIPEPATLAALAGAAMVALRRRRA